MDRVAGIIRHPTAVRLRRFAIVGAAAAAVQTALLWAFVEVAGLFYLIAAIIAIEITILLQYVLNNSWTFRPARHRTLASYLSGLFRTNVVRGTAIPIQTGLLWVFVTWADLAYLVANLCAILFAGVYRYYLDSRWTWNV